MERCGTGKGEDERRGKKRNGLRGCGPIEAEPSGTTRQEASEVLTVGFGRCKGRVRKEHAINKGEARGKMRRRES